MKSEFYKLIDTRGKVPNLKRRESPSMSWLEPKPVPVKKPSLSWLEPKAKPIGIPQKRESGEILRAGPKTLNPKKWEGSTMSGKAPLHNPKRAGIKPFWQDDGGFERIRQNIQKRDAGVLGNQFTEKSRLRKRKSFNEMIGQAPQTGFYKLVDAARAKVPKRDWGQGYFT